MPDFTAKMHKIQLRLGLRPRPRWGAQSTPHSLTEFRGRGEAGKDLRRGRGTGKGRKMGKEGTGKGGEWGTELGGKGENVRVKGEGMEGGGEGRVGRKRRVVTETF